MSAPRGVPPGLFAESYPELAQCFPRPVLDAVFNSAAEAWEGGPEDTLTWCKRRLLELLAFLSMRSHVEYGAPRSESLTEFYCPESDVVPVMRALCWAMSATSSEERTSLCTRTLLNVRSVQYSALPRCLVRYSHPKRCRLCAETGCRRNYHVR